MALLARQGWKLMKFPNSYCARMLKGIYFPHSNFINASRGRRASWAWTSIIHGRSILLEGIRWQVNNRASVLFWDDKWIPSILGFKICSPRPANCEASRVVDVIDPVHKSWKVDSLNNLVSAKEVEAICTIPISEENMEDTLVWQFESKGSYSVKSGYHVALKEKERELIQRPSSSFQLPKNFWKFIWSLTIPPKIRHFWWRVCKNGLATKVNLFKQKCAESGYCPICNKQLESVEHLLFECDWVKLVWFVCEFGYKISWSETQSILKWSCKIMEYFTDSKECNLFVSSIACIGWFVWKERNEFVFSQKPIDPLSTLHRAGMAKKEFDARSILQGTDHSHRFRSHHQREDNWRRPAAGKFKINCDVAIQNGSNRASIVAILWDSNGRLLDGVVKKTVCSSFLQGEALACRLACQLALARNLAGVEIEGDSKSVIHLSISKLDPPWHCGAIFFDIKQLAHRLNLLLSWSPRAANKSSALGGPGFS